MIKKIKEKLNNAWIWIKVKWKKLLIITGFITIAIAAEILINQPIIPIETKIITEYNGKIMKFDYTDENINEPYIIRTEKAEIGGWDWVEVPFSITNVSGADDFINIKFYMENGKLINISELVKNSSYEVDVNDYGDLYEVWDKELLATTTIRDYLGKHKETQYKDKWKKLVLSPSLKKDVKGYIKAKHKVSKHVSYSIKNGETIYLKAKIDIPNKRVREEFFIVAEGLQGDAILDPWYDSNYTYCQKITIDNTKIATTTVLGYALLATSTQAVFKSTSTGGNVQFRDGRDIIITDGTDCNTDGGSLLNFEPERYSSTTGELIYWTRVMNLSSTTDTFALIMYGNSSATDQSTTTGVWGKYDRLVNHIAHDEVATTTSPDFPGSTSFANDITTYGLDSGDLVAGKIGGGINLDGLAGQSIETPDTVNWTSVNFMVSFWAKLDATPQYDRAVYRDDKFLIVLGPNGRDNDWSFNNESDDVDGDIWADGQPIIGAWEYVVFQWDNTANLGQFYINGVKSSATNNDPANVGWTNSGGTDNVLYFFNRNRGTSVMDGIIDEIRMRVQSIHPADILTDYNCQSNGCVSFGAEETETETVTGGGIQGIITIFE